VMASEKVTSSFPGYSTARTRAYRLGNWLYKHATTVYSPNRHGATRSTVFSFQPRVVSSPRYERISWKVVSSFQRPTYVSITSCPGLASPLPLTRGGPWPEYGGGGSHRLASG